MSNIKMYFWFFLGRIRRLFFMQVPETERDYKITYIGYLLNGITSSAIGFFVSGVVLASMLSYMGVKDALVGIITSAAILFNVSQLLAIPIAKKIKKKKLFVCFFSLLHRMMFALLLVIPFSNVLNKGSKVVIFVLLYSLAYLCAFIVNPPYYQWMNSMVPANIRGKFLGTKEALSVLSISVVTFIAGAAMDKYAQADRMKDLFGVFAIIVAVLAVMDFIALSIAKEPQEGVVTSDGREVHGRKAKYYKKSGEGCSGASFFKTVVSVLKDKNYRPALIVVTFWSIAYYLTWSFWSIYAIADLRLSYFFINTTIVVGGVIRIFISSPFGRIGDKISFEKTLMIANGTMAAGFFINSFTVPSNGAVMYAVFLIIMSICQAALNPCNVGIQIEKAEQGRESAYIAVSGALSGIVVFITSLLGGSVVEFFQENSISLFSSPIYGQQVLTVGSALCCLTNALYLSHLSKKRKKEKLEEVDSLV